MSLLTPGWGLRLVDLFGAPLEEISEQHLERLITNKVREDADLDFKKERYGKSEGAKREFAADLAAMANDRGGVIVIGMRDEDDVAAERTPVELVDGEEGRLRLTAAGNLAPHVMFQTHVVPSSEHPGRGYYVLVIPPSTSRPHAVRKENDLRYPRRDGTTRRWLSEVEVADMYRDRFRSATDQSGRIDAVLTEGLSTMDMSDGAFVAVGLVPTNSGSMSIDLARVRAVEQWAKTLGQPRGWAGCELAYSPSAGVGARRVTLPMIHNSVLPPNRHYAELHSDGSGFACVRLSDPRSEPSDLPGTWMLNGDLLLTTARCLRLLGRHATEHTGAWGDALVVARVIGTKMRLAYLADLNGVYWPHAVEQSRELDGPVSTHHTLMLESLAGRDQDLLAATR